MQLSINVLIDDAHLASVHEVTAMLVARGFALQQTLESIGVLSGTAFEQDLDALRRVPGVLGIEQVREDYGPA